MRSLFLEYQTSFPVTELRELNTKAASPQILASRAANQLEEIRELRVYCLSEEQALSRHICIISYVSSGRIMQFLCKQRLLKVITTKPTQQILLREESETFLHLSTYLDDILCCDNNLLLVESHAAKRSPMSRFTLGFLLRNSLFFLSNHSYPIYFSISFLGADLPGRNPGCLRKIHLFYCV